MPIYRYEHSCGYKHDQWLETDKNNIMLKCERCGGQVSARQVRDKTTTVASRDEVKGILRHETN